MSTDHRLCNCSCHMLVRPSLCRCNCNNGLPLGYHRIQITSVSPPVEPVEKGYPDMIREDKKETPPINVFEFKRASKKGMDQIKHVKNKAYDLYSWILNNVAGNRERSLAITKLEEAVMWINKAISRSDDN